MKINYWMCYHLNHLKKLMAEKNDSDQKNVLCIEMTNKNCSAISDPPTDLNIYLSVKTDWCNMECTIACETDCVCKWHSKCEHHMNRQYWRGDIHSTRMKMQNKKWKECATKTTKSVLTKNGTCFVHWVSLSSFAFTSNMLNTGVRWVVRCRPELAGLFSRQCKRSEPKEVNELVPFKRTKWG